MITIGSKVRVKYPFKQTFSDEYIINDILDGIYYLYGIDGGFDLIYLEEIA